jgi:transposase
LLVGLALGHLEHLEAAIARLDARVDEVIARSPWPVTGRVTITGVGKRAAEAIIAELGVDMSVFCDRRPPGLLGGPLPGQQHHRWQAPLW